MKTVWSQGHGSSSEDDNSPEQAHLAMTLASFRASLMSAQISWPSGKL